MPISTITSQSTSGVIASGNIIAPSVVFNATFNGTTTMTVNSVSSGAVRVGQVLSATGYPTVTAQLTGTSGGAGTYTISATVSAQTSNYTATAFDFLNVPSWAKRITVIFSGLSNSVGYAYSALLGTASGIQTSGYVCSTVTNVNTSLYVTSTNTYFSLFGTGSNSACQFSGTVVFTLVGSNTWVQQSMLADGFAQNTVSTAAGRVALPSALTRVRIVSAPALGFDYFDAGSINILYE